MNCDSIDIEKLENMFSQAIERTIKIHNALNIPYITSHDGKAVEMLHDKIMNIIEENVYRKLE